MIGYVINLDSRPDRLAEFRKQQFPFEVVRVPGIVASCGEDGCTASHLLAITKQDKFPFVVFEDDCVLSEPWVFVETIMKQLPSTWDALWLGGNVKKQLRRYSENLYHCKSTYALHAVIYNSKNMVEYILRKHHTPSGKNLDIFYRFDVQQNFNCFITYPMLATQRPGISNINGGFVNYEELKVNYNRNVR